MVNPLLLLATGPAWRRTRPRAELRRVPVGVPDETPSTDAIFLVLRRMRVPLIVVVAIFTVAVLGLTVIPRPEPDGTVGYMSVFEAFYFISYAATTIGFGEAPGGFTNAHRLWTTYMIYFMVIGWAYAIGSLFAYLQDSALRNAIALQRFRRRVQGLKEPFLIVAGHGQVGRAVVQALDALGRSFVVVDTADESLDALAATATAIDAPSIHADARDPAILGLAGLGHKHCEGILALTNDDNTNLAIVMATQLLRPAIPVIARANSRAAVGAMHDFEAEAVINPFDRYGTYLVLRLQRPVTHQLVTWLLSSNGTPPPPRVEGLADGRWVVSADGRFGREIVSDLEEVGLDVELVDPIDGAPDVRGAIGFVAGGEDDAVNLSMAGHARLANPEIFLSVRQKSKRNQPLLTAFAPDSVFIPSQLTAQEILARVVTPAFWEFIEHIRTVDDATAGELLDRLVARVGRGSPESRRFTIDAVGAPAVTRWLAHGHRLTLGDLFRDPDDRDRTVGVLPVVLRRGGEQHDLPSDDEPLEIGDDLLLLGSDDEFDHLGAVRHYDHVVEYVATGVVVPQTWLWRLVTGHRD